MAIARISDTIVQDMPRVILAYIKDDKKNELDTKLFESSSLRVRDIVDRVFPVMGIISLDDVSSELNKYSELTQVDKDFLLTVVKQGLEASKNLAQPITSQELGTRLNAILSDTKLNSIEIVKKIKELFKKAYYFTDSDSISPNSYVFVAANYNGIVTQLTARINGILKAQGSEKRLGQYLDLGHSAARIEGTDEYLFNSPKLIATLFDISTSSPEIFINKTIDLNKSASIFAKTTGQLNYTVEVSRDFGSNFMNLFVSIGGSLITYENSRENQARGALEAKEKFGTNKPVLAKLAARFKEINEGGLRGLFNTRDLSRIVRELVRSSGSPSALDFAAHQIVSALTGKSPEKHKSTKKATSKKNFTLPGSSPLKPPKAKKLIPRAKKILTSPGSLVPNLLQLINANLFEQIKKNMGDGNRRDVLNYRTGRLARSASVERISESRNGMITAFYTYMKNPYATFSSGGMQQYPKTRDPKLLISKSIREIAAEQVQNRLRAVLV